VDGAMVSAGFTLALSTCDIYILWLFLSQAPVNVSICLVYTLHG
jgi:hypothetical protein